MDKKNVAKLWIMLWRRTVYVLNLELFRLLASFAKMCCPHQPEMIILV